MTRRSGRVVMARDAARIVERAARRRPEREVGGLLVGFRSGNDVHVEDVIVVADPTASRNRFVLREGRREKALQRYRRSIPEGSPLGYVGTWHSHPADVGPSWVDRRTFRQELLSAPDSIAMVVLARCGPDWRPVALVGRPHFRVCPAEIELV